MQSLDYILAQSIGRGSFGSVYYAINKQSGEEVAIKVLNKKALEKQVFFNDSSDEAAETGVTQVYDEISFMRNFVHPFLMRFIDSLDQDDKIYIVTELGEGIVCSIHQRQVPENTGLPDSILNLYQLHNSVHQTSTVLPLALHVAAGLAFMHRRKYVHGDIKPANILRTADGRYILGDFGLAKSIEKGKKYREIISPAFAAPDSQGLTPDSDVWAFGVCLFMLLYGEHPAVIAGGIYDKTSKITHWGEVLVRNRREWKRALEQRKQEMVEQLTAQNRQVGDFYQVKLNHDIIATTYGILSEVVLHCLAGADQRVKMDAVYARLLDFYCKVQAAKYSKLFDKGFPQQLRDIAAKLQVDNAQHMAFLVALGHVKNDSAALQLFKDVVDGNSTDFSQIQFQKFEKFTGLQRGSKLLERLRIVDQGDPAKSKRNISTPPILGKIKDEEQTPSSGVGAGSKFKKTFSTNTLASKLSTLSPPADDPATEDSDNIKIESAKPQLLAHFKKATPSKSLASQLASLPPPPTQNTQINAQNDTEHLKSSAKGLSSDSEPFETPINTKSVFQKKPCVQQSLASRLADMPPPQAFSKPSLNFMALGEVKSETENNKLETLQEEANFESSSSSNVELTLNRSSKDMQPNILAQANKSDRIQELSESDSGLVDIPTNVERRGTKMASVASNGPEKNESEDSSSFGIPLADRDNDGQLSDSATASQQNSQSIYGKFKKPVSLAASMAAKLATLPPPSPDEPAEDDDTGYLYIRAAKPKAKETVKYDIDLREKTETKTEQSQEPLLKRQSFTQILSKFLADDDVFALQEEADEEESLEGSHTDGGTKTTLEIRQRTRTVLKTDMRQRSHFFLSTAEIVSLTMAQSGQLPNNKQVKSLFKQISYATDEYKMKQQAFRYDHENDQAKILGLGSFACETLSTGKRSDGTNDFSDSDDDLVEFDAQGDDDFNNTFNEVFNIEEDEEDKSKELSAATAASLVNRGKGKFRTVKESEEEDEAFKQLAATGASIVEEDETSEQPLQKQTTLPFTAQFSAAKNASSESNSGQFEMRLKESSTDDADLPAKTHPVSFVMQKKPFQLNLQVLHGSQETEAKIKLFDGEEENDTAQHGLQSARILNSGRGDQFMYSANTMSQKRFENKEPPAEIVAYLVSARAEHVDAVVLSPQQTIIFFHSLVNYYKTLNMFFERSKSALVRNDEYIFTKAQLDEVIDAVVYDKPSVLIITVEIFMARFEQWKHQVQQFLQAQQTQQVLQNDQQNSCMNYARELSKTIAVQFAEYEQLADKSPAFLTNRSSWVLYNQISFYLQLQQRFKMLAEPVPYQNVGFAGFNAAGTTDYTCGISITINEQEYIKSAGCEHYHDVQIYIGLDFAECTPIVGLRHKVENRAIAVQQSYNCGKMIEDDEALKAVSRRAKVVTVKSASMNQLQNCFFRFKFLDLSLSNSLAEFQFAKSHLIKYSFANICKQVIMPFAILDSFLDLLHNARAYSPPSTIRASFFNADGAFYMIVSDCGRGMTQEQAEMVFNPQQPENEVQGFCSGIGAGMARLRLVVGLYGGIINVSSEEGCGCRIIVKIPMEDEEQTAK